MFLHPSGYLCRHARIERTVCALKHVHEPVFHLPSVQPRHQWNASMGHTHMKTGRVCAAGSPFRKTSLSQASGKSELQP